MTNIRYAEWVAELGTRFERDRTYPGRNTGTAFWTWNGCSRWRLGLKEMIYAAMMQENSNNSMTAYRCYIKERADFRDMKGVNLHATTYIVLCVQFGYSILNCGYKKHEIYIYKT